jgi:hypothetical protein
MAATYRIKLTVIDVRGNVWHRRFTGTHAEAREAFDQASTPATLYLDGKAWISKE